MGLFNQHIVEDWASAILARHAAMGLGNEEAAKLVQDISDSANDPSVHALIDWVDVWAQKPVG